MVKNLTLLTNKPIEEILLNQYLKQENKELDRSIKTVFGLLDAEANKSRTLDMRISFLNSILYNILKRASLFELDEEEYIKFMMKLYKTYKHAQSSIANV